MTKTIKTAQFTFAQALGALRTHKGAGTPDIAAVLKGTGKFGYTEALHALAVKTYKVDVFNLFQLPQKQVKRAVQFIGAAAGSDYHHFDATTACGLYALHLAPNNELSFDSLHFLIAGIARAEGAGGDTKGVQRSKLARMFAKVGVNTVSTQKSRSFGNNGFCDHLGITGATHGTKDRIVSLNTGHPLVVKFLSMIDKGTDSQIDSIGGKVE